MTNEYLDIATVHAILGRAMMGGKERDKELVWHCTHSTYNSKFAKILFFIKQSIITRRILELQSQKIKSLRKEATLESLCWRTLQIPVLTLFHKLKGKIHSGTDQMKVTYNPYGKSTLRCLKLPVILFYPIDHGERPVTYTSYTFSKFQIKRNIFIEKNTQFTYTFVKTILNFPIDKNILITRYCNYRDNSKVHCYKD